MELEYNLLFRKQGYHLIESKQKKKLPNVCCSTFTLWNDCQENTYHEIDQEEEEEEEEEDYIKREIESEKRREREINEDETQ